MQQFSLVYNNLFVFLEPVQYTVARDRRASAIIEELTHIYIERNKNQVWQHAQMKYPTCTQLNFNYLL